jgi:hypothetical protein
MFGDKGKLMLHARQVLLVAVLVSCSEVAAAQTLLPTDADPSCKITDADFKIGADGFVANPDSLKFPSRAKPCAFYKWAVQTFLWVTSRAPPQYKGGKYVFDSPLFYEVPGGDEEVRLVAKSSDRLNNASASISQLGPRGEPVVFDEAGNIHDVVRVARLTVQDKAQQWIEFDRVEVGPDGTPSFVDKLGRTIDYERTPGGAPVLRDNISGAPIVVKPPPGNTFVANGQLFFLNPLGKAIAIGPGQAGFDHNVLMAQGNKIVYYIMQVNDVYAYFLTGVKNKKIVLQSLAFPTTEKELDAVVDYANRHKMSLPDARSLVVELKSAWIELPDVKDYISIEAMVRAYKAVGDHLEPEEPRKTTLALVGMHVVFSLPHHPDLVWATFEHVNNTPNAPYSYNVLTQNGVTTTGLSQQRCYGTWLFSSGHIEPAGAARSCNGETVPACLSTQTIDSSGKCVIPNQPGMCLKDTNIIPCGIKNSIGPTDVLRVNPWGIDPFLKNFNTDVISVNESNRTRLKDDVRRHYLLIGATWLEGFVMGASNLANSTMETFVPSTSNCLKCHSAQDDNKLGVKNGGVSHAYWRMKPLFGDPPRRVR